MLTYIKGMGHTMRERAYLMENDEEEYRLDIKTDRKAVEKQALWAGIQPGMKVADVCCGSGKTTSILYDLVQPGGTAIGIDGSEKRLGYGRRRYGKEGLVFTKMDILEPKRDIEPFDFVWVRFVLEYYRSQSFELVKNFSDMVKPGGVLCLVDLDQNCLNHSGMSGRLERTLVEIVRAVEERENFDPYAGRHLYSHFYRLGYQEIDIRVDAHHLIFGELKDTDAYNWMKKLEVASKRIGYSFHEYEGGFKGFSEEFYNFFTDPGRFTYTPVISVRGRKADRLF